MTPRRRLAASAAALALLAGSQFLAGQSAHADGDGSPGGAGGAAGPAGRSAAAAATAAQVWITTADGGRRLERAADAAFDGGRQDIDLSVDASDRHQRFTGAGASLTEASARLMSGLPSGERRQLMESLFAEDGDGIGLDYLRQPLGGSDFVAELPFYSYEDERGGFSVDRDRKEILPLLREALAVNPDIRVMGSPWSAPGWMKDGGKLEGGSLRPEFHDQYADYLVKAIRAYGEEGVPLDDLTVQNEPRYGTGVYPSMEMTAPQQADLLRVLDEKLTAAGLGTDVYAYDHNWDHPEYPLDVLEKTRDIDRVQGAAFHCYGGNPESQQQIRDAGRRVLFTECSGTDGDTPEETYSGTLKWQTENLVVRSLRAGAETVVTWNTALDEYGGPHFGNCAAKCNGVVEIDGERVVKNAEFYVLGHVSKFVDRGARRIGSTTQQPGGVQDVVFENPDGSRAAVVLNSADTARTFSVTEAGRSLEYELPAGAVATFTWAGEPAG